MVTECCCKVCTKRKVGCHATCDGYKTWKQELELENLKVKKRKRECGGGIYLDFNSNTRW